jgi:hypothetical protein
MGTEAVEDMVRGSPTVKATNLALVSLSSSVILSNSIVRLGYT